MKARIKWIEDVALVAEAESGHGIVLDGALEIGGHNLGLRPMEMVLIGLGGCTAMDVLTILQKQRQKVTDLVIELEAHRRESIPKVFNDINVHYVITGIELKSAQVKRAIELSADKYCSVSAMLDKTAKINHSFEIKEQFEEDSTDLSAQD